ncbi:MAG: hypothetical protein U0841_22255 [Chloroflexia bacterium]
MSGGPRPFGHTARGIRNVFREELEKRRERRQLTSVAADPARFAEELAAFEEAMLQAILDNNLVITQQLQRAGVITDAQLPRD